MKLASLWSCTLAEAQARCSSREFVLWKHWYRMEPWGEERADLRNGILCALLANIHRKRGTRHYKAADFMPDFRRKPKAQQTSQEMYQRMRRFTSMYQARRSHGGNRQSHRDSECANGPV